MSPALFLGWRIDSGGRYRNVVKALDYQDYRIRGLTQSTDVPEPELYVEDGPLPEIDLKEVPFPPEGEGIAAPPTPPAKRARGVDITVERIIRFKETPGCKGCSGDSAVHRPACRERFTKLVDEETEEARRKFEERARAEVFGNPQRLQKKKLQKLNCSSQTMLTMSQRPKRRRVHPTGLALPLQQVL